MGAERKAYGDSEFHLGFDEERQELILWKRGRKVPTAYIPLSDAHQLTDTLLHVMRTQDMDYQEGGK